MNKSQLVESIAKKSGLTNKDSAAAVNAFLESVKESLSKGEAVTLIGFGSFLVRDRAARSGRNPRTGKVVDIPAVKVPAFKAGKPLKDAVNK
ncbi:MAG: HU family DNA-binding protein [Succinatimonas sp.]|nr:HU family DNA-binding protein [Succinatimonas sp.]MDY5721950.1 HU family DNA-binding protein [Succinivibrio sp.]